MSYALNNAPTADDYTPTAELRCPSASRVNVIIDAAGAAYLQFGHGVSPVWEAEELWTPVVASLGRPCDAIRARSAKAGTPTRVTFVARTASEAS